MDKVGGPTHLADMCSITPVKPFGTVAMVIPAVDNGTRWCRPANIAQANSAAEPATQATTRCAAVIRQNQSRAGPWRAPQRPLTPMARSRTPTQGL